MTTLDSWRALATERPGMAIYPEMIARPAVAAADSLPADGEGHGHPHDSVRLSGHHSRACVLEWCAQCTDPACDCECHRAVALAEAVGIALDSWQQLVLRHALAEACRASRRREAAEIRQAWRELRTDPTRLRIRSMHTRYPHRRSRRG
jgi:hypothetical protein